MHKLHDKKLSVGRVYSEHKHEAEYGAPEVGVVVDIPAPLRAI